MQTGTCAKTYLDDATYTRLCIPAAHRRTTMTGIVREGIDLLLEKYSDALPPARRIKKAR